MNIIFINYARYIITNGLVLLIEGILMNQHELIRPTIPIKRKAQRNVSLSPEIAFQIASKVCRSNNIIGIHFLAFIQWSIILVYFGRGIMAWLTKLLPFNQSHIIDIPHI